YDLMGLAYKNINVLFKHLTIRKGKILSPDIPESYFSSGDEILVAGKQQTGNGIGCIYPFSSFPSYDKIWAINSNISGSGTSHIFFVDRNGNPYNGDDVTLKVIRSGRRNILSSVGSFTSLENPVKYDDGDLALMPTIAKVVNAKSSEFKQIWKIDDKKIQETGMTLANCQENDYSCGVHQLNCTCNCLASAYSYLNANNQLFNNISQKVRIDTLKSNALSQGFSLIHHCGMMDDSAYYYALTTNTTGTVHRFKMGNWTIRVAAPTTVNFRYLKPWTCTQEDTVLLHDTINYPSSHANDVKMYIEGYRDVHCDTLYTTSCKSIITDTSFNPYVTGAAGNWRLYRNYSYYDRRAQSDPSFATNIRTDGAITGFSPGWDIVSNSWAPVLDPSKWVWNSEMTLFNKKGFEIENKDPLGRYNAGLYGYNLSIPIAVIQNSRYRESGFDGFEDYDFKTQVCDTVCTGNRQMDFTSYKNLIDNTVSHTGRHSIKLTGESQASLQFQLSDTAWDNRNPVISLPTASSCGSTVLGSINVDSNIVLPAFSPLKGKKMLLSAWVREEENCLADAYVNNSIIVAFDDEDNTSFSFHPSGPVIEGWQRYEFVFDVPEGAKQISVGLMATGAATVNFDDIRIHPYNANMKSFVFDPINLRLMAELDENNYATLYEYDDDGTLIRLKKETQKGIKTIKETRSALLKE
ncbi:MAG: hypothetical protein J7497_07160, partial [Chitinophagaceae bacterium]|nr:hypothetical protein [Chitinophagaceae bacterium]